MSDDNPPFYRTNKGFYKVTLPDRYGLLDAKVSIQHKSPRKEIERIFTPDRDSWEFTLMMTEASHKAMKLLTDYVRQGDVYGKNPTAVPKADAGDYKSRDVLRFSPELMRIYLGAIDQIILETPFLHENYARWPAVDFSQIVPAAWPWNYAEYPQIHLVAGSGNEKEFEKIILSLNEYSSQLYEAQNRIFNGGECIAEIDTLKAHKVPPLIIRPKPWQTDGKTLRYAVNFLVPPEVRVTPNVHYSLLDD
ncbi:MAG: hypothetical protein JW727_04080 [Candidatus Aenigmarchaeota archaeon]|nr:hypothetical protein [Candidatus Aenigmarchaeota archaeon]